MEHNESIYEEILTSKSGNGDDRIPCYETNEEKICSGNKNVLNAEMEMTNLNEDSLYAVVNGEELEFKKLGDLLNDDESQNQKFVRNDDIAQDEQPSIAEENNDSGCDCSQTSRELQDDNANLRRPISLKLNKINETVYSEILHLSPASQIDLRPARLTRESDNPILRQEVVSSNSASPSSSKPPSRSGSFKRLRNGDSTRSGSGDSGIQEDFPTNVVYGNCTSRPVSRKSSFNHNQVYENAASPVKTLDVSREIVYANMDDKDIRPKNNGEDNYEINKVYENLEEEQEERRPRAASQPITIQRKWGNVEQELLYSDLDFKEQISIESYSSSPGDASSSSSLISSSSNTISSSVSPPPLPNRPASVYSRRRQTSFSSVSMASYSAANALKAHFIGSQTVQRATTDSINSAILDVAHKNTMLDIKSVSIDIRKNVIHFGKLSPPYDCILQFSVDDIHYLDKYSKDEKFIGIIVSKPGKDAICYVLQSDQSTDIIEMIKDIFRENSKRARHSSPERPKSLYGLPEFSKHNHFSSLIRIGSLKVKKTYLVINESISSLLEKTNPKDYKQVNISIQESAIIVSNPRNGENEEQHSVPWVLSLGLYNKDARYFAFTVTRTKNGKTRMFCHVFRSNRAFISTSVLEGIRSACQSSLSNSQSAPRISRSMPRDGFHSNRRKPVNPDVISRSSTSSEETITHFDSSLPPSAKSSPILQKKDFSSSESPSRNETSDVDDKEKLPENKTDNVIYSKTTSNSNELKDKHEEGTPKERRNTFFKGKAKLFRGTISKKKTSSPKLSSSMNSLSLDPNENGNAITPVERMENKFIISYLCSAVVNPPLKPKHVEKCLKQFHKEVGKKRKDVNPIGNVLMLELISDEGVTMVDMRNPDAFRRHFPISTIDSFVMHPDDPDCFAFSTTVSGDQQRKYHVFYKAKESISDVKKAFDLLKQTQIALGI